MISDIDAPGYMSEELPQNELNSETTFRRPSRPRQADRASRTSSRVLMTPPLLSSAKMSEAQAALEQESPGPTDNTATDTRQFTPTLHASLVSEILGLRRELESKNLSIEGLESTLAEARTENDTLHDAVSRNARESRAVKKQLQSIEESTLSALESLAKERDEANDSKQELRRRLEESQKRARQLEDEGKRITNQQALDKASREIERRTLERRAEVAEGRLKSLIEEVAAANQTAGAFPTPAKASDERPQTPDTGSPEISRFSIDDDAGSLRNVKGRGHQRQQSSVNSIFESPRKGGRNVSGLSLADELAFDEEEEKLEAPDSPTASFKAASSEKDGKVPQIVSDFESRAVRASVDSSRPRNSIDSRRESSLQEGITSLLTSTEAPVSPPLDNGNGANQARRRDPPLDVVQARSSSDLSREETRSEGLATEISNTVQLLPSPSLHVSSSTQTDWPDHDLAPPTRAPPPVPGVIPTIAIHAPEHSSESGTGSQKLPPNTKSLGCQTDFVESVKLTRSIATQTEGIRVDTRPVKLPTHLLPSAISDSVASFLSMTPSDRNRSATDTPGTSVDADTKLARDGSEWSEPRDGVNDAEEAGVLGDGMSADESAWARLKKAFRSSQQMLDFPRILPYDISEGDGEEEQDEEYRSHQQPVRSSFRSSKYGRPAFDPPTPVPEDDKVDLSRTRSQGSASGRPSTDDPRHNKSSRRRSTAHSKSPSYGSAASSSNFSRKSGGRPPIPPRASSQSRQSRYLARSGFYERGSIPFTEYSAYKNEDRSMGLRKARSAALMRSEEPPMPRPDRILSSAKSASPIPNSADLQYPPIPTDSAAYRHHARPSRTKSFIQTYDITAPTGSASVGATTPYSAVDAITSCMIGEWMWKYVRKRKSFGVTEAAKDADKHAEARHRRWVWISPYDRTIMWSSKQPTSNAALMGKAGRKLEIQSVLDVKDDTPPPKSAGHDETFSRSILILTPARALKFTATTRERHHLWLTALSFLSQQNADAVTDIKQIPSFAPPNSPEPVPPLVLSNRGALASVRSSMGKSRSSRSSGVVSPVTQAFDSHIFDHSRQESVDLPDAAMPPSVPRIPKHMRQRSSTNPSRGRPALGAMGPVPNMAHSSNISAVSSQVSVRPSRAPSIGNARPPALPEHDDFYASESHFREPSPRPSNVSADFGCNSNFFDAGGLVRMTAFVSPGVTITTSTSTPSSKDWRQSGVPFGHTRNELSQGSNDSMNVPPPIGRIRKSFKKKDAARRQVFQRRKEEMALEGRHVFSETEI